MYLSSYMYVCVDMICLYIVCMYISFTARTRSTCGRRNLIRLRENTGTEGHMGLEGPRGYTGPRGTTGQTGPPGRMGMAGAEGRSIVRA